jgi:hypothetical protein
MRIQRKSFTDYSWAKNPNAVYIGRPTIYGNPYSADKYGRSACLRLYRQWLQNKLTKDPKFLDPLKGKDLVCFCALHEECHADVITEFLTKQ